jgi:hypothetical protein
MGFYELQQEMNYFGAPDNVSVDCTETWSLNCWREQFKMCEKSRECSYWN